MKRVILLFELMLILAACEKEFNHYDKVDLTYGKNLKHEMIVLGKKLDNPYNTENMKKAVDLAYPTKSSRVEVSTTNLYVRFLPNDEAEYKLLEDLGVEFLDHPLDFEILVEGDYYHDPSIAEDNYTWQYAVVSKDFDFPNIRYEILQECFLPENSPATKSDGLDWDYIESIAYELTGNKDHWLSSQNTDVEEYEAQDLETQTKAAEKIQPSGRITIIDPDANGGKPIGVAGVKVSCNTFVKFSSAYTDRDGYYQIPKSFSSKLRYRLIFENEKNFAIGVNLILVPASISTLGKDEPDGINLTITNESEEKLFRRAVVNNAVYDYITGQTGSDKGIAAPPKDLRIWIFASLEASSASMIHHGALVENSIISNYLGPYAKLVKFFAPDITIGAAQKNDYKSLYTVTCHELAHASHFSKVGVKYWNKYIYYILESFVSKYGKTYGDGSGENAGYCEVGEMWAYYLESVIYKERYGGSVPTFGNSYWFRPQIFRYLDDRGIDREKIFEALDESVNSRDKLKESLIKANPSQVRLIDQVFNRYSL